MKRITLNQLTHAMTSQEDTTSSNSPTAFRLRGNVVSYSLVGVVNVNEVRKSHGSFPDLNSTVKLERIHRLERVETIIFRGRGCVSNSKGQESK